MNIEKHKYDAIHDVVVDITGKSLTPEEIDVLIIKMPFAIISEASQWGFWDTCVRDKIYEWYESELKGKHEII